MPALTDEIGGPAGAHHRSRERDEHQDDERNRRTPRDARVDGAREHETRRKADDDRADEEHRAEHEPVAHARVV